LLDNNCDIPGDAINVACKGGYKDIVEMLIKHNVDINFSGGWLGVTPIYFACLNGHTDVVQILLDNNCDIPGDAINVACKGGYKDTRNVTIIVKQNLYNICMTIKTGKVYWCNTKPTTTKINVNIMFYQHFNNRCCTDFT
jgi:ankyrin repeat protein